MTARFCAAAKPKAGADGRPTQTAFPDDDPIGLELRVSAEGRKVWTFRYRTLEGRQRRLTLGVFAPGEDDGPGSDLDGEARPLTLRAARRKARQSRAVVEDGGDPAAERRKAKEAARAQTLRTFDDLADAYLQSCEIGEWKPKGRRKRERTISDERKILTRYVRPVIGALAVEEITRATLKRLLRGMVSRGIGAQTNRTHAVVRQVFSWAISEERTSANPAAGLAPMAAESPRARVLSNDELKALWAVVVAPGGRVVDEEGSEPRPLYLSRPVAIALQLSALLLQRRNEVAGMMRSELDVDNGAWLIPAERMKGGRPHLVPLPPRAVELIREALTLADLGRDNPSPAVFPGRRDPRKGMRPDALSHAFADVAKACGIEGATLHDLRRTGASAMASERVGITPFVVSRVLGHTADTGGAAAVTLRHYALHDYAPEKRRALEAWEALLLEIVGERVRAPNVRVIAGGRQ
ncbi:site-specific integrase [Phenylobacterium sp.]|uniref:tyrosine-type recombinase/integrase n=1 Tax=Phenylobacterium sp. TaxID=1871053 RepID=UPI0025DF5D3C|nr:site-specific integrase [Phenylobacterium sp.]